MVITLVVPDDLYTAFGQINAERPQAAMVAALKEWLHERTADEATEIHSMSGEPD